MLQDPGVLLGPCLPPGPFPSLLLPLLLNVVLPLVTSDAETPATPGTGTNASVVSETPLKGPLSDTAFHPRADSTSKMTVSLSRPVLPSAPQST